MYLSLSIYIYIYNSYARWQTTRQHCRFNLLVCVLNIQIKRNGQDIKTTTVRSKKHL